RMVRAALQEHSMPTPQKAVATLAGSHVSSTMGGRILGVLKSLALLPVKKIFRKIFLVLWVKDCVDMASLSLHHGYLLQHALAQGHLDAASLTTEDTARRVHTAIDAACKELDARPVNQVLRRLFSGSQLLLTELAKALDKWTGSPRTPQQGEAQEVASLAERLAAAMWEERGYFQSLESLYEKHFRAP
ncbi:MAG TPA: hypothetical protein VK458_13250, partial [Myxococcaceae bacterium]|nr:hypothetical protein [Myxococcaceae bacterium]